MLKRLSGFLNCLVAVGFLLAGGGYLYFTWKPTIDTSSMEAYQKSVASITQNLPQERRAKFQYALMTLLPGAQGGNEFGLLGGLIAMQMVPNQTLQYLSKIDGKTGEEVIRIAAQTRLADLEQRGRTLDNQISELETLIRSGETAMTAAAEKLKGIEITNAKYYWTEDRFLREARVAFFLTNRTDRTLSAIRLMGVLKTPGREVPWISAGINHAIRGGVAPGETREFRLEPGMLSDWASRQFMDIPKAVLTLTVVNAEDAAGFKFINATSEDLNTLKTRLKSLQSDRIMLGAQVRTAQYDASPE